ncbi:hypothetical protein BJ508DRAFT_68969 [Ascobolus immersus RN42]|uniref:Uncharacterized protein n=1 Tax=Ascobolus immersus RN42 TaxID=1160509 RepID=A0A3N4HL83_ASCIM|nr:hypothetical protein BJ508DRAFT_68969 [Ascobolus immersus RN42]
MVQGTRNIWLGSPLRTSRTRLPPIARVPYGFQAPVGLCEYVGRRADKNYRFGSLSSSDISDSRQQHTLGGPRPDTRRVGPLMHLEQAQQPNSSDLELLSSLNTWPMYSTGCQVYIDCRKHLGSDAIEGSILKLVLLTSHGRRKRLRNTEDEQWHASARFRA